MQRLQNIEMLFIQELWSSTVVYVADELSYLGYPPCWFTLKYVKNWM